MEPGPRAQSAVDFISGLPVNLAQATLHDSFFCPARIIVRDTDERAGCSSAGRSARKRFGGHVEPAALREAQDRYRCVG